MNDMTRRDYFAMAALAMLDADTFWVGATIGLPTASAAEIQRAVARAYQWADAMLAASGAPDPRLAAAEEMAKGLDILLAQGEPRRGEMELWSTWQSRVRARGGAADALAAWKKAGNPG